VARTILVTGANTGIGAACARALAAPGVHLILACRSEAKTTPVLEDLRARGAEASFLALDLADLAATRTAARAFRERHERLDVLVNNAGLAGIRGLTKDGFEITYGTNHLGHFELTLGLLPAIGRVVNVSSGNHYIPKRLDLSRTREPTRSRTGLDEYSLSKLCNVLFTAELRRRSPSVEATSVHPGRIASDVWRSVPPPFRSWLPWLLRMRSVEEGAEPLVLATNAPAADLPLYFHRLAPRAPNPLALREDLGRELWEASERAIEAAIGPR
jgi:NAD(P)-dependent dehydrogenase (short-subunit alcohol dehydrogenase family)